MQEFSECVKYFKAEAIAQKMLLFNLSDEKQKAIFFACQEMAFEKGIENGINKKGERNCPRILHVNVNQDKFY